MSSAKEEIERVLLGFDQGDLVPLAEYLASGALIDERVRQGLRALLPPDFDDEFGPATSTFKLEMRQRRPGRRSEGTGFEDLDRLAAINAFVEERKLFHKGRVKPAIADAIDKFGVRRTVIMEARSKAKRYRYE